MMNSEQFKRFVSTLKAFESPHIKYDKTEIDEDTGSIVVNFIQMPRGVQITISDRFDITPELEAESIIQRANYAIKDMAAKDLALWTKEKRTESYSKN